MINGFQVRFCQRFDADRRVGAAQECPASPWYHLPARYAPSFRMPFRLVKVPHHLYALLHPRWERHLLRYLSKEKTTICFSSRSAQRSITRDSHVQRKETPRNSFVAMTRTPLSSISRNSIQVAHLGVRVRRVLVHVQRRARKGVRMTDASTPYSFRTRIKSPVIPPVAPKTLNHVKTETGPLRSFRNRRSSCFYVRDRKLWRYYRLLPLVKFALIVKLARLPETKGVFPGDQVCSHMILARDP